MALNTIKCERMAKCANMAWCDGTCFPSYPCYRPTNAASCKGDCEDCLDRGYHTPPCEQDDDEAYWAHICDAADDAYANREHPMY